MKRFDIRVMIGAAVLLLILTTIVLQRQQLTEPETVTEPGLSGPRQVPSSQAQHAAPEDARIDAALAQVESTPRVQATEHIAPRVDSNASMPTRASSPKPAIGGRTQNPPPPVFLSRNVMDRFEKAQTLDWKMHPVQGGGARRDRLVRMAGKYPLIRVEDHMEKNTRGQLEVRQQLAMVADQLLVQPAEGVSADRFEQALADHEITILRKLRYSDAYVVQLPEATLDAVPKMLARLDGLAGLDFAEGDYLVFTCDDVPAWADEADLPGEWLPLREGQPILGEAALLQLNEGILNELPAGGQIITFDAPTFLGGVGTYSPRLMEQNMVFESSDNMLLRVNDNDGFPLNGTHYARSSVPLGPGVRQETEIFHNEGLSFTLFSIDLAEYSTVVPSTRLSITGLKPDGSTVTHAVNLDGVMDGSGPLADFETVRLPPEFTDLQHVTISPSTGNVHYDNVVVIIEGTEVGPQPPPELPVLYDVTWDAPLHTVDEDTAVGGPYAPTSINFGNATVVDEFLGLTDRPLIFEGGEGLQQIRFAIYKKGTSYRLEYDFVYNGTTAEMSLFIDGNGVQKIVHQGTNIGLFQSGISGEPGSIFTYVKDEVYHVTVDIDSETETWTISVDEVEVYTGPFDFSSNQPLNVRFSYSSALVNNPDIIGIDNFKFYVFDAEGSPDGPRIVSNPEELVFPPTPRTIPIDRTLRIRNLGVSTLTVSNLSVSLPEMILGPHTVPEDLLPGGFMDIPVTFTSTVSGVYTGTIDIVSNDPDHPTFSVPVAGEAHGWPDIDLDPTQLNITMRAGDLGSETFTIENNGDYPLDWEMVSQLATNDFSGDKPVPVVPDDSSYDTLWGLTEPDETHHGIDAPHAWALSTGSHEVVVAVIDTGVDGTHPELAANMWINTNEVPGNAIDDDQNGYIDDVYGWDFRNDDNDPSDGHSHGTHVAGTIAAAGNNSTGIVGVAWSARIMPLKFLSDKGSGSTSDAIEAIGYATAMGAELSNNSWGGGAPSIALFQAIEDSNDSGALFIAAAGNKGRDNDGIPQYPSGYDLPGVVSVAASKANGQLALFSNYGLTSVDLVAPGQLIWSLLPNGKYGYKSGTSMAAPHVSGVTALILDRNPSFNTEEVKHILTSSVDVLPEYYQKVASEGRLNAYQALVLTPPNWLQPVENAGQIAAATSQVVNLVVDTRSLEPGDYENMLVINSNDPNEPRVELPVLLQVVEPSDLLAWQMERFGESNMLFNLQAASSWAIDANPDGDDLGNALEFFYGTDPMVANEEPFSIHREGGQPVATYQKNGSISEFIETVEWTRDLETPDWLQTDLIVTPMGGSEVPGTTLQKVTFSTAIPDRVYLRLRLDPTP